jgi:hypothetical protein
MPELRDVPDDFVEVVMNTEGGGPYLFSRRWRTSVPAIQRWLKATNLTERVQNPPVPKSWGDVAPTMNRTELARHYSVRPNTIARWVRETDIQSKPKKAQTWVPRGKRTVVKANTQACEAAANYLRNIYRNVHKCSIYLTHSQTWGEARGLPDKGRGLYFVHSVGVISNEQMLKLAREHGYEAGRV